MGWLYRHVSLNATLLCLHVSLVGFILVAIFILSQNVPECYFPVHPLLAYPRYCNHNFLNQFYNLNFTILQWPNTIILLHLILPIDNYTSFVRDFNQWIKTQICASSFAKMFDSFHVVTLMAEYIDEQNQERTVLISIYYSNLMFNGYSSVLSKT